MSTPNLDLDGMEDRDILRLAEKVKDSWRDRDEAIRSAQELRQQKWDVVVPPAWKQSAGTFHSGLAKQIPARVVGTIAMQPFNFSRAIRDDDQNSTDKDVAVARWHQAHHQWQARNAIAGKNSWIFTLDQLINKGAVCAGSIFAPHAWAGSAPLFMEGDQVRADYWRDDAGHPTKDPERMNLSTSSKGYMAQMDAYRRQAVPPIKRRIVPTEQAYPLFVEGHGMVALFIFRKASILDLSAGGWSIEQLGGLAENVRSREMIEVITPNKCRYYWNKKPLEHPAWGKELITNYGRVMYTYRVGLEGGELDYGSYGMPLLSLVDENIRMIDTCLTYEKNAMYMASFTSWYVEYDAAGQWNLVEGDTGRKITTFDFKTGSIMDFGPYKTVKPLLHPGLNKDFHSFLEFQINEVNQIIPRALQGVAESSGYNTAQASIQAKSIFYPIADAAEAVAEDLAMMDMQHISKRTPGPVYLYLEQPRGNSSKPKNVSRISTSADDINNYYQITATMDRELDRVTLGNFALQLMNGGVGDDEWVWEMAGGTDYQQMVARRARMQVRNSPQMMAMIEQDAIKRFGMLQSQADAQAAQKIVQGPDGTPMVRRPDGSLAGPGQGGPKQSPQGQGAAGAALGGANPAASAGAPNMQVHSPNNAMPGSGATDRFRRRGGANPGAPQRQGATRPGPVNNVV